MEAAYIPLAKKRADSKRILVCDVSRSVFLALKKIFEPEFSVESKSFDWLLKADDATLKPGDMCALILPWSGRQSIHIRRFLESLRRDWRHRAIHVGVIGVAPPMAESGLFYNLGVHAFLGSPLKRTLVIEFKEKTLKLCNQAGDFERVVGQLQQAMQNNESGEVKMLASSGKHLSLLGDEMLLVAASFLEEAGEDEAVEELLGELVKRNPQFVGAGCKLGSFYSERFRYAEAEELFGLTDKHVGKYRESILSAVAIETGTAPRHIEVQLNSLFSYKKIFSLYKDIARATVKTKDEEKATQVLKEIVSSSKVPDVFKTPFSKFVVSAREAEEVDLGKYVGKMKSLMLSGCDIQYTPTVSTPNLAKSAKAEQKLKLLPPVLNDQPGSIIRNSIFQIDRSMVAQADADLIARYPGLCFGCLFVDEKRSRIPMSKLTEAGITHTKKTSSADSMIEWVVNGEVNFVILHVIGAEFTDTYKVLRTISEARGFRRPMTLLIFEDKAGVKRFNDEGGWFLYNSALLSNDDASVYEKKLKQVIFTSNAEEGLVQLRDKLRDTTTKPFLSEQDNEELQEALLKLDKMRHGKVWSTLERLYLDMHFQRWTPAVKAISAIRKFGMPFPEAEKNASMVNIERFLEQAGRTESLKGLKEDECRRLLNWLDKQTVVSAQDYFSFGQVFLNWGEYAILAALIEQWSNRSDIPKNSKFHLLASCYCVATGQPKEAKLYAYKALLESPTDVGAVQHLCVFLEHLGDDKLIKDLWRSLMLLNGFDVKIAKSGYIRTLAKINKKEDLERELRKLESSNLYSKPEFEQLKRKALGVLEKMVS